MLPDELEGAGRAAHDLSSHHIRRRELRPHPPLVLDVEHVGQSAYAHAGMNAHVGVECYDDVVGFVGLPALDGGHGPESSDPMAQWCLKYCTARSCRSAAARLEKVRSEEHTSELQSRLVISYA